MCGFAFRCSSKLCEFSQDDFALLRARGPDYQRFCQCCTDHSQGEEDLLLAAFHPFHITLAASVLSLRGNSICHQPVIDRHCMFVWNGEAWANNNHMIRENDTALIFRLILDSAQAPSSEASRRERLASAIAKVLGNVKGPFSFLLFDSESGLFFGRDFLGRRSLLYEETEGENLTVTSVPFRDSSKWVEVDPHGFHFRQLRAERYEKAYYPWALTNTLLSTLNRSLHPVDQGFAVRENLMAFRQALTDAVHVRVQDVPAPSLTNPEQSHVAFLFSGGRRATLFLHLKADPTVSRRSRLQSCIA